MTSFEYQNGLLFIRRYWCLVVTLEMLVFSGFTKEKSTHTTKRYHRPIAHYKDDDV